MIGKVYIIYSTIEGQNDIYIGSTFDSLESRWSKHKYEFNINYIKSCTSQIIFEKYGIENCKIICVEELATDDQNELKKLEGSYQRIMPCVNRCIAGRTQKEYYQENKEELSKKQKIYFDIHKEEILQKQQIYRDTHKEEISTKKKILFICECGSELRKEDKARHCKSKKHLSFIENKIFA